MNNPSKPEFKEVLQLESSDSIFYVESLKGYYAACLNIHPFAMCDKGDKPTAYPCLLRISFDGDGCDNFVDVKPINAPNYLNKFKTVEECKPLTLDDLFNGFSGFV